MTSIEMYTDRANSESSLFESCCSITLENPLIRFSTKTFFAAAFLGLLGGCGSTPSAQEAQYRWEKPGTTDNDWNQERGQCMAQSFSATAGNPAAAAGIGSQAYGNIQIQQAMIFASCMQGKGWMRVRVR